MALLINGPSSAPHYGLPLLFFLFRSTIINTKHKTNDNPKRTTEGSVISTSFMVCFDIQLVRSHFFQLPNEANKGEANKGDGPSIVDFLTFLMGASMMNIWEHVLDVCILRLFLISNQQFSARPLFLPVPFFFLPFFALERRVPVLSLGLLMPLL
jgi:hypothetical protein